MSAVLLALFSVGSAMLVFHLATRRDDVSSPPPPRPQPPSDTTPAHGDVLVPPARPARPAPPSRDEIEADESRNARQRDVLFAQLRILDVPREIRLSTVLVKRPDDFGRMKDVDEISEAECKLPESELARRMSGKVGKTYRLGPFHVAFNDTDSAFSVVQAIPDDAFPDPTSIPMSSIKYASVPHKTYSRSDIDALMGNLRRQAGPTATNKDYGIAHGEVGLALFESVDARVVENRVRGTTTRRKLYVFRADVAQPADAPIEDR
eukprot:jgi/Mesvir1/10945/Mv11486-RA.1